MIWTLLIALSLSNSQTSYSHCPNELTITTLYESTLKIESEYKEHTISIGDESAVVKQKYLAFYTFHQSCLNKYLEKSALKEHNNEDLQKLFSIINKIDFYSPNQELDELLFKIINIKKSRGEKLHNHLNDLHRAYIKSRDFERASTLEKTHPNLQFSNVLPVVLKDITQKHNSIFKLSSDNNELISGNVEFPTGDYLVIISSPICSPSNRFINWLNAPENIEFRNIITKNALFLTPPASSLFLNEWVDVNASLKPNHMVLATSKMDWQEIPLWDTPTFYFYKDGKLIKQIIGWPEEGRIDELEAGLITLGFLGS